MPLFTASAGAQDYDGDVEVIQLVVAATTLATQSTCAAPPLNTTTSAPVVSAAWPTSGWLAASVTERPENCVLTPVRAGSPTSTTATSTAPTATPACTGTGELS